MTAATRLKASLKNFAKKTLYRAGYYHARHRAGALAGNKLVILMYHNLSYADGGPARATIDDDRPTRRQLEAHLRAVTRRYRVVSMRDAVAEIRDDGRLREDSVAITFDDGNESFYTVAWPLLAEYDAPATVFLVSNWVEYGRLSWWQHLCELLETADVSRADGARIERFFGPDAPSFPAAAGKDISPLRRFAAGVEPLLRALTDDERAERLAELQSLLFPDGDFDARDSRVLTWQQVREMAGGKIDFESHTRTHVHIPTAGLSVVEREIRDSKKDIERHTGRAVTGFAYPYGKDLSSYVPVERILRDHGFAYACNASPGTNSASSNIYSLCRRGLPLTRSASLIDRELCVFFSRRRRVSP